MPIILGKFFDRRQPLVRARLSNAVPQFEGDEVSFGPAAQRSIDVWALIDTGATASAIDSKIQLDFTLPQQGSKPVLFPNMTDTDFQPTYTCAISFFEHYSAGSRAHEWQDVLEILSFNLGERRFQAVIGMDILQSVDLTVEKGCPRFVY